MLLRVTKIERINHHPNIRRILARLPDMRDFNQFKSCLMEVFLELLVAVEIAIRLLDDDVAAQQKALQDQWMLNRGNFAVFAPNAIFSKSRNTAMVESVVLDKSLMAGSDIGLVFASYNEAVELRSPSRTVIGKLV